MQFPLNCAASGGMRAPGRLERRLHKSAQFPSSPELRLGRYFFQPGK
jgi:hypothetical protein